jgi:hypothetical protein
MASNPRGKRAASNAKKAAPKAKSLVAGVTWDATGDKGHVVALVVANQLTIERRWPPNDITKVMGTDYRYDQFSISTFLRAVQNALARGNPPYAFMFDGQFVIKALQDTVGKLMVDIDANTT